VIGNRISMMRRRDFLAGAGTALAAGRAFADVPAAPELQRAARDAWLFCPAAYRSGVAPCATDPVSGAPVPINVLTHARALAGPINRAVTTPNVDTLVSTAFIDTTKGVQLDVPDSGNRYLSIQIMTCINTPTTTSSSARAREAAHSARGASLLQTPSHEMRATAGSPRRTRGCR
jgi:hypothetical protein